MALKGENAQSTHQGVVYVLAGKKRRGESGTALVNPNLSLAFLAPKVRTARDINGR